MAKVICFDLEGPLSPQDNAFEVMGLVENGHLLFEAISRYDDLLTLEEREDYEPGDTLALIVPFLINHSLSEEAIRDVSKRAVLVDGAGELIAGLKDSGWKVYIISTSYEQHAFNIGAQLGVDRENIYCTKFPLAQILRDLTGNDLEPVADMERALLELLPIEGKDKELKDLLDEFYWKTITGTPLGDIITNMKVVGGARKVDAAKKVSDLCACPFSELAVVGDSITDFKMLGAVHEAGGLAAAFNANIYAIPYATISLASESLNDLRPVLDAFAEGGLRAALTILESLMSSPGGGESYYFHDLAGKESFDEIVEIHNRFRTLVRGKAANLG